MTLIMIALAFPIAWFIRNKLAGYLVFVALQSFLFTFQTGWLVLQWVGGDKQAFGSYPKASHGETLSYAVVNLVIFAIATGAVELTYRLHARQLAKRPVTAGSRVQAPAH